MLQLQRGSLARDKQPMMHAQPMNMEDKYNLGFVIK